MDVICEESSSENLHPMVLMKPLGAAQPPHVCSEKERGMTIRYCACVLAMVVVAGLVRAQEQPQEQPAREIDQAPDVTETRPEPRPARVVLPWSRLELTEEQRRQVAQIRRTFLEEQRAARERERQAVLALLTDEQKAQLQEIEEREAAERRARRAERAQSDSVQTQAEAAPAEATQD
jgi:hypothetical protein